MSMFHAKRELNLPIVNILLFVLPYRFRVSTFLQLMFQRSRGYTNWNQKGMLE